MPVRDGSGLAGGYLGRGTVAAALAPLGALPSLLDTTTVGLPLASPLAALKYNGYIMTVLHSTIIP